MGSQGLPPVTLASKYNGGVIDDRSRRIDEVLLAPVAPGPRLTGLDQAVDPLKNAVVDRGLKPLKNSVPMMPDRAGCPSHRAQTTVSRPEIPFLQ